MSTSSPSPTSSRPPLSESWVERQTRARIRERVIIARVCGLPMTEEQYDALTPVELDELRRIVRQIIDAR